MLQTSEEKYNVMMDVEDLSPLDKFALGALPAVVELYGINQPYSIAQECYNIARAMVAQKVANS